MPILPPEGEALDPEVLRGQTDPRLMGQLRWVVETVVGAVVDPCADTWRKPSNSAVTRPLSRLEFVLVDRLVSTVPVPGTLARRVPDDPRKEGAPLGH